MQTLPTLCISGKLEFQHCINAEFNFIDVFIECPIIITVVLTTIQLKSSREIQLLYNTIVTLFRDDAVCLDKAKGKVEIALAPDYDSSYSRITYDLNFCQGARDNFLLGLYKNKVSYPESFKLMLGFKCPLPNRK